MSATLKQIFNNLQGEWKFKRIISNILENSLEKAEGEAAFSKDNMTDSYVFKYQEHGFLQLSSQQKKIKFQRKFIYKYTDAAIEVYFDDGIDKGSLFQKLSLDIDLNKLSGSKHLCKLDTYHSTYRFLSEKEFETCYCVDGPKKGYTITTHYQKIEKTANL